MLDQHSSDLDWRLSKHIVGMFTQLGLEEGRDEDGDQSMRDSQESNTRLKDDIQPLD